MKLLVHGLNFWPELTGVGKYSGEMAQWLSAHGHAVQVVTAPPYYPEWKVLPGYRASSYRRETWGTGPAAVQVLRCPLWVPRRVTTSRRLLHLASFAICSLPGLWLALRRRPQVMLLLAPTLFVAPGALLLARLFRVPVWLHVQDFEVDAMFDLGMGGSGGRLRRLALAAERALLKRFDRVSSIAPRMVDKLPGKGVSPARCVLFPNWVDLSAVYPLIGPNPFRQQFGLADSDVLVLYAGNMGEKQGLEMVVQAAATLASRPELRFVLAGQGAARARLEKEAQGLPNIMWLPLQPVELLNALLNAADIHVLPQRADAADLVMPSKLTGMLASGRATVGTAAAGTQLGQVLDAAGWRVEPGDVAGLGAALASLAADSAQRAVLGQRARAYAEQHFAQDAIMTRFEAQLKQLVVEVADPPARSTP